MVTSLGQLLDQLVGVAESTRRTAATRADAATALGQVGRALGHLHQDGVAADAGARREREVAALATSCTELARHSPVNEGPLAMLAAASADSLAALHKHTTVGSRWAAATVLVDAVTPLVDLVADGTPVGAGPHLDQVRKHAVAVQQAAALQPPSRVDGAILDRPLAGPTFPAGTAAGDVVPDAMARLLRATADPVQIPTVAQVLAYTLAAETLSGAAQRLDITAPLGTGHLSAPAWRAVREALRPYDDGSRRPHLHAPPAVEAALRLHASLTVPSTGASPDPRTAPAVAAAAQHLPTLASQLLYRTVQSWSGSGGLVAFARDLPPRDERIAAYLRGYHPAGVVRATGPDLQPVVGALHNARLLSLAVAIRVGADTAPGFPHRALAANQQRLEEPAAAGALEAARLATVSQLLLGRNQSPGPTRSR